MVLIQLGQVHAENFNKGFIANNKSFFRYFRVHGLLGSTKIHSFLAIIGLCINFYFLATHKDYSVNVGGVSWFADIGLWFGPTFVTLCTYVEISVKSTQQRRLMSLINHLDNVLRDFSPVKASRKTNHKYAKYGLIQLIIGTTMIIISRNIFLGRFPQYYCQVLIVCHLTYAISMMFVFYFDIVHDLLGCCRDKVRELAEHDQLVWFVGRKKEMSERILSKISENEIFLIKDVMSIVREIFTTVNYCFGWTLVSLVVMYGLEIICNAYWIFLIVSNAAKQISIWDCICLIIPSITLLLALTHSVGNCANKLESIISILHQCNNHRDSSINYILSEITIESPSENLLLSARGLFTIKPQMIRYIVSTIFTYLIIFIQFKQKEGITPESDG